MNSTQRNSFALSIGLFLMTCSWIFISCTGKQTQNTGSDHQLAFKHQIIDSLGPKNPWAKILADINLDGYPDIIIGGQKGPMVGYLSPAWKKILITEGGYDTVDGEAGDIDGDGDSDIIMGGLFWYENPGVDSLLLSTKWTTHQIAEHPTHDVELGDINQDGKMDIITRDQSEFGSKSGNRIYVWIQQEGDWASREIDCPHGEGIDVEDIDGDGDPDIAIGGIWFENEYPDWTEHIYAEWYPNASVKIADINQDGKMDVVLTPSELKDGRYKISWFEQPLDESDNWLEHLIQDSTETVVHGVEAGDMDKDGWPDIITAEMHQGKDPDEVMVFINSEQGNAWKKQVLSTKGSHLIQIDDMDLDGDIDIMGANWSGPYQPIEVWFNQLAQ